MASRLSAAPSRLILDLLKTNRQMTRQEMFEATPRNLITSKTKIKTVVRMLQEENRVVAFLQTGKVKGIDNWVFKLNPMKERINFPGQAKKKSLRQRELAYVMSLADDAPILPLQETQKNEKDTGFIADDVFDPTAE